MGVTAQLAEWLVSTRFEDIPEKGVATVKQSMLDWIGCALAGSVRPAARMIIEYIREEGGSAHARVIGTAVRTTSSSAAFANGVIGHIEDFDDSGAHPASYLTPTVLALAEELHLSGQEILNAWAAGYEISARIAAGLHPDRAWHTTAIYGTMGATAAACRLMGLSEQQTRMALGVAASETAGLMRNFGTMTKAFHPGNAARSAIVAAKLTARGFVADADIIEGRYGYADCFGGEKCDLLSMTRFLGEVCFVASKPPAIKAWPTCSSNHQSLTAIFELLRSHQINAKDIERVEHYSVNVPGTGSLQRRDVNSGLEGKFCLEYNIAAAFLDGKVDLQTFSDERAMRGDLQAFMKKVYRYQSPEAAIHSGRTKAGLEAARLRIFLKGGTSHDIKLGPRLTLKGGAVLEKFRSNAGTVLPQGSVGKIIEFITSLDSRKQVSELLDMTSI